MNRRHLTALALAAGTTMTITAAATTTTAGGSVSVQPSTKHTSASSLPSLLTSVALPKTAHEAASQTTPSSATARARLLRREYINAVNANRWRTVAFENAVAVSQFERAVAANQAAAAQSTASQSTSGGSSGISGLSGFLACVAFRESRDNPSAVNPSSGAGGLFQFLPSTWANLGEPGLPENAPVGVQIAAAEKLLSMEGTSPWAGGGYSC